jgi:serine/threonine protein kinase/Tfp pilus assembly protein PilF
MGRVYKAHDTKIKEKIALKLIKPDIAKDKKTIERFNNELRLARKIRHKNVCGMFDLGEEKGTHYITMEFVPGEDLRSAIRRFGQLPIGKSISIAKQICEGLAEAHRLGVVHRDLKSNNIMIDKEGNVRIMDFGIARSLEAKGITGAGVMIGTPEYMSPEQVEGKEVDQRSDIYSLGIILYEMVTGRVPFEGDAPFTIGVKHKSEMPQNPKELNKHISDDLNQVILRCLEKEKEKRYQSVGEVRSELENIEKGIPTSERIVPERKPLTSKEITVTFNAKRLIFPALVVTIIIVVGLLVWNPWSKEEISSLDDADRASVVVLPFEDLSPQKDQEHFCYGLAATLINAFTQISELRIPAITSSSMIKEENIHTIGETLNVSYVLKGSLQKSENRVRITAQLIKVDDGTIIWSDQWNKNMSDYFSIQDEITISIVDKLRLKLLGEEREQLTKRYTEDTEAYNLYTKGYYFLYKRTEDDLKRSIECFEQAIELDPKYALAYAGLADAYITLGDWEFLESKEAYSKAKAAATKAQKIDDLLPEAHNFLAVIEYCLDWDWKNAEERFIRAIALNPNYAQAHQEFAEFLMYMGRFDEALREIAQAKELDQLSPLYNGIMALILMCAGEFDKAIEQCRITLEIDPNYRPARSYLGRCYVDKGMHEEALAEFQKIDDQDGIQLTYAQMGRVTEPHHAIDDIIQKSKSLMTIAHICFLLGEFDQGFEWLEKAYEQRTRWLLYFVVSTQSEIVRSDPRYKQLVEKLGLAIKN